MERLHRTNETIISCEKCPRLRSYCERVARVKKREFIEWTYWGKPIPGFGDESASLLIVGLAPAAHGGNRTGRMFTGDSSGHWLMRALHRVGLANQDHSSSRNDGLQLSRTYISAVIHCAPPDNKPLPIEIKNCQVYLEQTFSALPNLEFVLALGKIAFDSVLSTLHSLGVTIPKPRPPFRHGGRSQVGPFTLIASYHPSRQNTQTGRLPLTLWNQVFDNISSAMNRSTRKPR